MRVSWGFVYLMPHPPGRWAHSIHSKEICPGQVPGHMYPMTRTQEQLWYPSKHNPSLKKSLCVPISNKGHFGKLDIAMPLFFSLNWNVQTWFKKDAWTKQGFGKSDFVSTQWHRRSTSRDPQGSDQWMRSGCVLGFSREIEQVGGRDMLINIYYKEFSHIYKGWEAPWSAAYKLETLEIQGYNSRLLLGDT